MRAYCITIEGDVQSAQGFARLADSHRSVRNEFKLQCFDATTPETVETHMGHYGIEWNYPWEGDYTMKESPFMRLHAYETRNPAARTACFMSHYRLWRVASTVREPILVLEDDALFVRKLDPDPLLDCPFAVVGINDPRGATRKASLYHALVQAAEGMVVEVPWVDDEKVPQGLAGASAYFLTPEGADAAIKLTGEHGAWPNDATCCKQLMPGMLGQTRTYYTTIQGTRSTIA